MTQTTSNPYDQSDWLRDAWKTLQRRDPVDALNDADYLLRLAQQRSNDVRYSAAIEKQIAAC